MTLCPCVISCYRCGEPQFARTTRQNLGCRHWEFHHARGPGASPFSLLLLLTPSVGVAAAPQNSKDGSRAGSPAQAGSAALSVCLRMQDNSAFIGVANVRVMSRGGLEAAGVPSGSDGETIFTDISPGTYTVEASAPGFLAARQETQIEPGNRVQTVFLIMKPKPWPATAVEPSVPTVAPTAVANPTSWIPPDVDDVVPNVEKGVECPLPQVVSGVGRRMKELVENLEKFDATEHMENFPVNAEAVQRDVRDRTFDYVVTVTLSDGQVAKLEEYRNGSLDPKQFPAKFATRGLPTMALAFHPAEVYEFNLACEGLGQWDGHPAWQVHFAQRIDRPNRLRSYQYQNSYYPVAVRGRVWIDAGTYQDPAF